MESTQMQATCLGFNRQYSQQAPTFEEVKQSSGCLLLEFGAPWCGHCQAACFAVEKALEGVSDVAHCKVYDGKGKRLGRAFEVRLWPTLILLCDGQEVGRLVRPLQSFAISELLHKRQGQ